MTSWSTDDIVDFEPIAHSYTNRRTRKRYMGITTFIDKFKEPYDTEYWSLYKAMEKHYGARSYKFSMFKNLSRDGVKEGTATKHQTIKRFLANTNSWDRECILKLQVVVKKDWKDKNTKSLIKGSSFHQKKEDKANFNNFMLMNNIKRPLANVTNYRRSANNKINLAYDLPDGLYKELLLVNHEYEMAGQCDTAFIETINGIRYIDIDDDKTNEKLTFGNEWNKMLAPLDFLEECKMVEYRLQILLYAWLFEQAGFVVRKLTLSHTPDVFTATTVYPILPFQTKNDPIKLMLNVRKKQLESLNL